MNNQTHLKSIKNGRVFLHTDALAARPDMVSCNASGELAVGHIADSGESLAGERRITQYLGSSTNGVLYKFTDFLAMRPDMVSVDSPEQWEAMQEAGEAPHVADNTIAPSLSREKPAQAAAPTGELTGGLSAIPAERGAPELPAEASSGDQKQVETQESTNMDGLPDITGMGSRDAKTVLAKWAQDKFNHKIDRRPGLPVVVAECRSLVTQAEAKAAAG